MNGLDDDDDDYLIFYLVLIYISAYMDFNAYYLISPHHFCGSSSC
jgi:hypothetical protein